MMIASKMTVWMRMRMRISEAHVGGWRGMDKGEGNGEETGKVRREGA